MTLLTRTLIRQHLWRILLLTLVIVAIVTPIHVASHVEDTLRSAAEQGRAGGPDLALFVAYRAADVLTQVFPISVVLAVLWSETAFSLSGRRLMMQVAGRSAWSGVPALAAIAVATVVAQLALANLLRPSVVLALIDGRLGNYGEYIHDGDGPHGYWISLGDVVIQAQRLDRDQAAMEKVVVFRFLRPHTLKSVTVAERIVGAGGSWVAEDGFHADLPDSLPSADAQGADEPAQSAPVRFTRRALDFVVDPLWMRYEGIEPIYVPTADLYRLARSAGIPADQPDYAAALNLRMAKALSPALLTVLVAVCYLIVIRRRSPLLAAGMAMVAAYLGTVASDAAGVIGQSSAIGGAGGAWASPLVLSVACAFALRHLRRLSAAPAAPLARFEPATPGEPA